MTDQEIIRIKQTRPDLREQIELSESGMHEAIAKAQLQASTAYFAVFREEAARLHVGEGHEKEDADSLAAHLCESLWEELAKIKDEAIAAARQEHQETIRAILTIPF